jgi:AraC-like DNA-binding protein
VASIARASGFSTQAHFTSVFRRFVGKPPALWRRAMTASMALGLGSGEVQCPVMN